MTDIDFGASYELVLSFSDIFPTMAEERAFTHGFAFAGIWQRMRSGNEAEIEETTRIENRTIIARAAAAQGWELVVEPTDVDGWDTTKLAKVRSERSNPHGLRVIEKDGTK